MHGHCKPDSVLACMQTFQGAKKETVMVFVVRNTPELARLDFYFLLQCQTLGTWIHFLLQNAVPVLTVGW